MADEDFYQGIVKRGLKGIPLEDEEKPAPRSVGRPKGSKSRGRSSKSDQKLGNAQIAGYFSHATRRALKMLAVEEGTTLQALLADGINIVLKKHGKEPIAHLADDEKDDE